MAVWGAPEWGPAAAVFLVVAGLTLAWSYWRLPASGGVRMLAATLKAIGLAGLALCLVEPLLSGLRPRPGANIFAVAVDNSRSMQIRDDGSAASRGELLERQLLAESAWQARLGQDFDLRQFLFDAQLRGVKDFSELSFDGMSTSLGEALSSFQRRFRGLPVAGVLLLTDGNATEPIAANLPWDDLPPIYPVALGGRDSPRDVNIERVSVSQTNFDAAPVVARVDVQTSGYAGQYLHVTLRNEEDCDVETQTVQLQGDRAQPASFRFQFRPVETDVSFYRVHASVSESVDGTQSDEQEDALPEATDANNQRTVVVDRGGGPFRVLYVCGRPNWEFKFLRRALWDDDQLQLLGLVRIAKEEPRFTFRRRGQQSSKLFDGFDNPADDAAERYDEPVLVRLGAVDEFELRDGFPKVRDELYRYHAIVLDDLEADFFTQDQMALIEEFVSRRGGGLLMLGGAESLEQGGYERTPIGDALPVYLDGGGRAGDRVPLGDSLQLKLTREGWLQPWVRLRKTEQEEKQRLAASAPHRSLNVAGRLKPGADVLAEAVDRAGNAYPALAAQRFGRGRSAALLIGDRWRAAMRPADQGEDDLASAWRQTIRWLVADVPQRVEAEVQPRPEAGAHAVGIDVLARDAEYLPLDNCTIEVQVTAPDGTQMNLSAETSADQPGGYTAVHTPRSSGAYRAMVKVTGPDGAEVGRREIGWAAQPLADEFRNLRPNRELLAEVASKTGGELIELDDLDAFVASLNSREAPITEPWVRPIWHHPLFFLGIIVCLTAEWGLRRWKGLA